MRRFFVAVVATSAFVLTAVLSASAGQAVVVPAVETARDPAPTQGLIHASPECGNPITLTALDDRARVVGRRILVKGRPGVQLVPYDTASKPTRVLYVAFDCSTREASLFVQTLSKTPRPRLLLRTAPGQLLAGAAWDVMREQALAVIQEQDKVTFTAGLASGTGWTPLWQGNALQTGFTVRGVQGKTGGEFLLYGGGPTGGNWSTVRVSRDGYASVELTFPTQLRSVSSMVLDQATAYVTDQGVYVCDALTSGSVNAALASGACVRASSSASNSAAFTFSADSKTYWLALESSFGPNQRVSVSCPTGGLFRCGDPIPGSPTAKGAWR